MAIPNSPNWSPLTDIKKFDLPNIDKPEKPKGIVGTSIGPAELNNSQGTLNNRYWLIKQDTTTNMVVISGAIGTNWSTEVGLFIENELINQMALTFDQLGRPLILYTVGVNLKLYWYDPIAQNNVITLLGQGIDPVACFDFPANVNQSFTDVLLFYRKGSNIYMRVQRERYENEILLPVNNVSRLYSAGLRVDNRLQVLYR